MQLHDIKTEFPRPVAVDKVGANGLEIRLQATPEERQQLARRLGLDGVMALDAVVRLGRVSDGRIRIDVDFSAEVLQTCVISLEPVTSQIKDHFVELFASDVGPDEAEVIVETEGEGPPEAIVDGVIDVGELVIQYLSLAIDPYPRQPGAEGEVPSGDDAQSVAQSDGEAAERGEGAREDDRDNPFAALSALRRPKSRGAGH